MRCFQRLLLSITCLLAIERFVKSSLRTPRPRQRPWLAEVRRIIERNLYKLTVRCNPQMTSEDEYRDETERACGLLDDIRKRVRSIDGQVTEILDELREHFDEQRRYRNEWGPEDLDDHHDEYWM